MRAIEISSFGGPEVLRLVERPEPKPAAGELLVRVAAAGVNRPDLLQRMGKYPPPAGASDLPGLEVAGMVEAVGAGAEGAGFAIGDPVCALLAGGGYAEKVAVPAEQVLPIPAGVGLAEAAGVPETFFTVWTNVFERGRLAAGEWFMVHGGTSGIGTTAIQLARAFGAHVIATAGGPEKCEACRRLGADRAVDYRVEDFVAAAREATGGRGIDVILDMVGGPYVARNIEALASDGRLVYIAFLQGAKVEVNLAQIMIKRLTLTGSTLRARPPAEKGRIAAELRRRVWPLLADGTIKPVVFATFPMAQASEAHRVLDEGRHIGKVVLTMG
jgi:putative PIG3 family NAD(P)H quinone oxidoreductase